VDAQCHKLATDTCKSTTFRSESHQFCSYRTCILPHPYLAPPLGVTRLSFAEVFGNRKLQSLSYRAALFA